MPTVNEIAIVIILASIVGWFAYRMLAQRINDDTYQKEYQRQIRMHKLARPDLAPYIDAETTRRGEGVIK